MAQELKKIKKVEVLFICIICVLFLVLINKYFLEEIKKNTYYKIFKTEIDAYKQNKEFELAKVKNEKYNKDRSANNPSKQTNAKIVKKDNKWFLSGIDGYEIDNINNSLSIVGKNKNFSVNIDGIDEYFSTSGSVVLDIPALGKAFSVYEQEDFLPIVGYHYIVPDNKDISDDKKNLEIHVSQFENQINYMTNVLGCRWFTLGDLIENFILKDIKIPKKSCVISFDDGHEDGYILAFPILKKYNAVASFYIIADMIGKSPYMSWKQVDDLYIHGNEIGSHTLFGGGLLNADWFEKKFGRKITSYDLVEQINNSKEKLEKRGYNIRTFAYPLGEWNDEIVEIIKNSNYLATRDTTKDSLTLDRRTVTTSFGDDYVWHMYYYKPETKTNDDIKGALSYNTWWQFEDGYEIQKDDDNNVRRLSSLKLTDTSYEVVTLPDNGDQIKNKFILNHEGYFDIEFFGSVGEKNKNFYSFLDKIKIEIDGEAVSLNEGSVNSCILVNDDYYCSYFAKTYLGKGLHIINSGNNSNGSVRFDKFRISRLFFTENSYDIVINEFGG